MTDIPEWVSAQDHLRRELGRWIDDSIQRQSAETYHGIHDEGSFTFSWDAYYFMTRDERVRGFLTWLRDGFADWAAEELYHGYYAEGEVHHAAEPFTHFVARFRTLDPGNPIAAAMLDDVAEHTGNWAEGVPDWYDWDRHRFRSWHIGSRMVPTEPPDDYEEPDSIRPALITLAAYALTGRQRYLDFCNDYGDKWARALLEEPLPQVGFYHTDDPSRYPDQVSRDRSLEQRMELVVASGMIDYFLDLYCVTGHDLYRAALERAVGALVGDVADPRNSVAPAYVAKYRRVTGDHQFDDAILRALGDPPPYDESGFDVLAVDEKHERRRIGLIFNEHVGHRWDQVRWGARTASGELSEVTEPNPAAWALAYQITGEQRLAARAMFVAGERIRVGRETLDDGRDHGCAGKTLGAVASGHGRADRFGDVNSVLGSTLLGSTRLFSAEQPIVVYPDGLPGDVATLVRFDGEPTVTWVNTGDVEARIRWRDGSASDAIESLVTVAPGETCSEPLTGVMPRV